MADPKTDIWMPLFIGDYLSDTMHLSTTGHGAYLLLLMAYWKNGGPLPGDDVFLSGTAKLSLSDWSAIRSSVATFFTSKGGMWVQKRMDTEILQAKLRKQSKSAGAHSTNAKRWGHRRSHSDSDSESLTVSQNGRSSPSPSPSPSKEEKENSKYAQSEEISSPRATQVSTKNRDSGGVSLATGASSGDMVNLILKGDPAYFRQLPKMPGGDPNDSDNERHFK